MPPQFWSHPPTIIACMAQERPTPTGTDDCPAGQPAGQAVPGPAVHSPAAGHAYWHQPQLLTAPERPRARGTKRNDRLRQVGLIGIAQARLALAEATRRAETRAAA